MFLGCDAHHRTEAATLMVCLIPCFAFSHHLIQLDLVLEDHLDYCFIHLTQVAIPRWLNHLVITMLLDQYLALSSHDKKELGRLDFDPLAAELRKAVKFHVYTSPSAV